MNNKILTFREFIHMIRPILCVEQKRIRKIVITAAVDDAVRMDIECFGQSPGDNIDIKELEPLNNLEERSFLLTVKEVTGE